MNAYRCFGFLFLGLVTMIGCTKSSNAPKSDMPKADQGQAKAKELTPEQETKIKTALAKLSDSDRPLAEAQKFCPVLKGSRLGLMGTPVRIVVEEQPVFLCCDSCREKAFADPKETLAKVERLTRANMGPSPK